jgi:hypothetical protein
MINTEDFSDFFDNFIIADSNPFNLNYTETYKENGKVVSKDVKQTIELVEVSSPVDLIINNSNIETVDYYPKTFLKKLFKIKNKVNLSFESDDSYFVFLSDKTSQIFKTDCKRYNLEEDDKVIIVKKSSIIIYEENNKLFAYSDPSNFRTILIR